MNGSHHGCASVLLLALGACGPGAATVEELDSADDAEALSAAQLAYQLQRYDTTSTTCIGVTDRSSGTPVTSQPCSDDSARGGLWRLRYRAGKVSSGLFQLASSSSGLCITRTGAANAQLVQRACGSSAATDQFFSFHYVNNGVQEIVEASTGLCVSAYPGTVGQSFVLARCDATPKLEFHLNSVALTGTLAPYSGHRTRWTEASADPASLRASAARAGLRWGTMVDPTGDHFDSDAEVRALTAAHFNLIEPGVQLKWSRLRPSADTFSFEAADRLLDFAAAHDLQVRGHTLAWDVGNPAWLTGGGYSPAQLQSILVNHINGVIGHFRSKYPQRITTWDVVNEPMGWNDFFGGNGTLWTSIGANPDRADYLRVAFRTARAADPTATLCLNDYANEGTINPKRSEYLFNLVKQLRLEGVPIDCVGFESHLGNFGSGYQIPTNDGLRSIFARYAQIGVEVQVTEYDFVEPNAAADWTLAQTVSHNLLQACLQAPNCTTFNNWGFSQKYLGHDWGAGLTTRLMFDFNHAPSPVFSTFRSVLRGAPAAPAN